MSLEQRLSGISSITHVPWGTHICLAYETQDDLLEVLVPYLIAGLESNEMCYWVVSNPLTKDVALRALARQYPQATDSLSSGQLTIVDYSEWYLQNGSFQISSVIDGWIMLEKRSIACGFDGLRVTGNTSWLDRQIWDRFMEYEELLYGRLNGLRILALCSYNISALSAFQAFGVFQNHQVVLARDGMAWRPLQNPHLKASEWESLFEAVISPGAWEATYGLSSGKPEGHEWC